MRYVVHFGPEAMHIELEGTFTFADTRLFHKMMGALANVQARNVIRLNMSGLTRVDATAVSLLMQAHDHAKRLRRELVFVDSRGQVRTALDQAALYNYLNIAA